MHKRVVLFFVLSMGLFLGTIYLRNVLYPPPPPPPKPIKPGDVELVQNVQGTQHAARQQLARVIEEKQRADAAAKLQAEQEAQAQQDRPIVLGDQRYKLIAVLSAKNAAVRKITLTYYQAADRLDAQPTHMPLVLVNDDFDGRLGTLSWDKQLDRQSFRLLFYESPTPDKREPLYVEWTSVDEQKDDQGAVTRVVFRGEVTDASKTPRAEVVRTLELKPDQYHLNDTLAFRSLNPDAKGDLVYEMTGPRGLPIEGEIWKTSPYRQVVYTTVDAGGSATQHLRDPQSIRDQPSAAIQFGQPFSRELQYAGVMVQYFASLIVVNGDPNQLKTVERITPEFLGADENYPPRAEKLQGRVSVNVGGRVRPAGDAPVEHRYLLYAGPAKVFLLNYEPGVRPELADHYGKTLHMDLLTDAPYFSWLGAIGWTSLVVFFTDLMHWLLEKLSYLTFQNTGLSIILLTVIVRLAMFPISRKQALTSLKMQKLQPELKKLQEKYKDDLQARNREIMELYRKHGVNPFSGCLILLIQMPIFMGLYYALNESVHLRLTGFLWIDNLGAPDMLAYWENWPLIGSLANFLGLGPYLNLLPILAVALMVVQQKLLAPPAMDEQQAMQMRIMNFMMIFFAYMFYWVAAGLCVYFIVSSAWGILERKLLPKIVHADQAQPGAAAPARPAERPGPRARGKTARDKDQDGPAPGWLRWLGERWNSLLKQARKK
jgi:YidC/Oxa1 family membrane protein insertase